jgi:hypothetical protein
MAKRVSVRRKWRRELGNSKMKENIKKIKAKIKNFKNMQNIINI